MGDYNKRALNRASQCSGNPMEVVVNSNIGKSTIVPEVFHFFFSIFKEGIIVFKAQSYSQKVAVSRPDKVNYFF
jgi:hypothetical protein